MGEPEIDQVLRARAGDGESFGALVERHWERMVRMARSMVGEVAAEDVVQDAMLQAWRKLGSLGNPAAFGAWLGRIVYRTALGRARRQRFMDTTARSLEEEPAAGGLMDEGIWVQQLLARLAPRQRAVLHLTVVEGMSDAEIGELLGIGAASVRAHRRRARGNLERHLKEPSR